MIKHYKHYRSPYRSTEWVRIRAEVLGIKYGIKCDNELKSFIDLIVSIYKLGHADGIETAINIIENYKKW